jgi:hypothetical protein
MPPKKTGVKKILWTKRLGAIMPHNIVYWGKRWEKLDGTETANLDEIERQAIRIKEEGIFQAMIVETRTISEKIPTYIIYFRKKWKRKKV